MTSHILEVLIKKYNKATLTKNEVAQELGLSLRTIDNMIQKKMVLPKPLKIGDSKNAPVRFNIVEIAKYIADALESSQVGLQK